MFEEFNKKSLYEDLNKKIKLKCNVYGGYQKNQTKNLVKIPKDTIGIVKYSEVDNALNIKYYLIKFIIEHKFIWAKVNNSTFVFLEDEEKDNIYGGY